MLHSALEKETKNTQADNMECYTNEKKMSFKKKKKNIFSQLFESHLHIRPSCFYVTHTHVNMCLCFIQNLESTK